MFQTLYKNNTYWTISISPDYTIVREYGKINGTPIINHKSVSIKNKGKKNETSLESQSIKEATALYKKQLEKGYTENIDSSPDSLLTKPMLAQNFEKHSKHIKFPCYVQPKLDGIRLLVSNKSKHTRTGKLVTGLEYFDPFFSLLPPDMILDGEIYSTDMSFENICSSFKSNYKGLQYHIFDIVDTKTSFKDRYEHLLNLPFINNTNIFLVPIFLCNDITDINKHHASFISDGFEGIMIRNNTPYEIDKRSYNLQKLKSFTDSEYSILDIKEAPQDTNTALIICDGFTVRPKGSYEYRSQLLKDKTKLIGKLVTIRYQNLTDNNIPRFPVAVGIRDYE